MSWFSSIKEKSLKIAHLYKSELSEFVTNLQEDIGKLMEKENDSTQDTKETPLDQSDEVSGSGIELPIFTSKTTFLLEILKIFLTQAPTIDELNVKISTILSNPDEYIYNDPTNLMIPHRIDFTCFQDFQKQELLTPELFQGILNSNSKLSVFVENFLVEDVSKEDSIKILLSRFLYCLIYFLEDIPGEKDPKDVATTIVSDAIGIDNSGDASEKKSETSEQYVVVEDGSSSSHHEVEKIESTGQRDMNNLSESDEWQIEDKPFSVEF